MKDRAHTIWVTEKILSQVDLSDKKQTLKKYTDNINDCDEDLFTLIEEVIVDDQEAEIVEALEDKTKKLKKHNQELLEDTDQRIHKMVTNLNEQVEDIKEQQLKITYKDPLALA